MDNDDATAAHELGHAMGLAHSGRPGVPGDVDPQCKPNYGSLMNYAYLDRGATFSDGTQAATLNTAGLLEHGAANPTTQARFLQVLSEVFRYRVDTTAGHVDWNRDGEFAPPGQLVRAYANFEPGGQCEYTRYNGTIFSDTALAGPALARILGHTLVLIPGTGALRWRSTSAPLICPFPNSVPCATFIGGQIGVDSAGGVDAAAVNGQVLVVMRGADSRLRATRITGVVGVQPQFSAATLLDGPLAADAPSLTADLDGGALLVWKSTAGTLQQRRFDGAGFGPVSTVRDEDGAAIVAATSPALTTASLFGEPRLLMLATGESGSLTLRERDPLTGRFVPGPLEVAGLTSVRPAMAWVPDAADVTFGGRLTIVYVNGASQLRQLWTHVGWDFNVAAWTPRIGLDSFFDNEWSFARGVDLLFEPGFDTNLRAAYTHTDAFPVGQQNVVEFRPKADGINDFAYGDWNDWRVIRTGLCEHVVNPGGVVPDAVECPDRDWYLSARRGGARGARRRRGARSPSPR
jgi:hypothetical protein